MSRQIVLDTETTGLRVEEGHRVIEVGCVEMINRKLTGNHFHRYLNPGRAIDAGALAVHGLSNEFLNDKPVFSAIAEELLTFISDAELIIHNAPFDLGFLNNEFMLTRLSFKTLNDYCPIVDTLKLARQLHAGQKNSLDALCKRYGVDNTKRELHGALLDANLLAQVYLSMTGGQGSFFDGLTEHQATSLTSQESNSAAKLPTHHLMIASASEEENAAHENYLQLIEKQGKCVWR